MVANYIVVKDLGRERAIVFDGLISHKKMAELFDKKKIVSAGMVNLTPHNKDRHAVCFGGSSELDLNFRREDNDVVALSLNLKNV